PPPPPPPEAPRRSRKATPPWSRRRATQPARRTWVPASPARRLPQAWVRMAPSRGPLGAGRSRTGSGIGSSSRDPPPPGHHPGRRAGRLLAGAHVADGGLAGGQLLLAEDDHGPGAGPGRGLHVAVEGPFGIGQVGDQAGA